MLVFIIIAGAANAVNLTDGLDGLAAGTSIVALFTLTAMAVTIYIRSGAPGHRIETRLDAAFVGAAVIGAAIGFLWFNAWPAEVFMGDTGVDGARRRDRGDGDLPQGRAAAPARRRRVRDRGALGDDPGDHFKWWGRRVFLMAPIHHHFEMKEPPWSETKIMVRFWIVAGILCAAGFALFYKYYPQIRPRLSA